MGVLGLWRLIDATGKPVPVETLEGKVLAIDISIWIHQVLQGYQDRHGNPKPNAHLIGLFNRICKLLYYKIKPVFVFDGGVPMLKKSTIAARRKLKSIATSKAQKMKADLINNLIKHAVVKSALNKGNTDGKIEPSLMSTNVSNKPSVNDVFKLPELTNIDEKDYSSSDDSESSMQLSPRKQTKWMGNIHNVDLTTTEFKSLPADVRYDILTDLKETRKQNSWGRLHEMPEESHEFSSFQMKRLLKRRFVQESLESAEKEMGGKTLTLEELDKLLTEQGVETNRDTAYRIASDSTSRVIYISDKDALIQNSAQGKINKENILDTIDEELEPVAGPSGTATTNQSPNVFILSDGESDSNLTGYSSSVPIMDNINEYEFDSDWELETDKNESLPLPKKYLGKSTINPALTYMLEHSGLSQEQIMQLIEQSKKENNKKNSDSHSNTSAKLLSVLESSTNNTEDQKKQQKMNSSEETEKNVLTSQIEDSNSNVDVSTEKIEDHCSNSQFVKDPDKDILDKETIDMSDSDSDDFIEIPDVPILNSNFSKETAKEDHIEIVFKSDDKIDDDIFADVFKESNKKPVSQSTESVTSSSTQPSISTSISQYLNEHNHRQEGEILETSSTSGSSHEVPLDKKTELHEEEKVHVTESNNMDKEQVKKSCSSYEISLDKKTELRAEEKVHVTESSIMDEEQIKRSQEDKISRDIETVVVDDVHKIPEDFSKEKHEVLPTNETELLELQANLEDEQKQLTESIGKLERQATDISDQIRIEAQELLRLFGFPYIVAPMEAEAQCAYLEQIKLTEGTITDDSDIWLFGGQCVYKNFFNNNKTVLQFQFGDIQHHFKLTREQMIQLALLVGSDYTTGIPGIGPVTALEILAAFPAQGDNLLQGLITFSSWIQKDRAIDSSKKALRNKLRNIQIEKGFPSQAVVQAYMFPSIDESKEKFTWGQPNIILLTDYAIKKFGWSKDKFEKIMKPVLKRMEESKQQKLIDSYFKLTTKPIKMNLSKRIQKAVESLNNEDAELNENETNTDNNTEKAVKKRRPRKSQNKKENGHDDINLIESSNIAKEVTLSSVPTKEKKQNTEEYIPQREKDKANALKKKMHAIEVFRKSKSGLSKTKKVKRNVRKIIKEAKLSESSDSN